MGAISRYTATRYIVPLKEGGSLPAVLDTEEDGKYVAKFRGAGQGAKALIAEIIVGRMAQELGLPVPDVALIELDESFGRTEKDPEIQDILKGSRGVNVGLRYLEGAFNYDPVAVPDVDPDLAASIVWFDALVTNIDRTPRNTNMMYWKDQLWLIDHGAALFFHHAWSSVNEERINSRFVQIRDHVLLPMAGDVQAADGRLIGQLRDNVLSAVMNDVPDELLMDAPEGTSPPFETPEENRTAYCGYFTERLQGERPFVEEILKAQEDIRKEQPTHKSYRR